MYVEGNPKEFRSAKSRGKEQERGKTQNNMQVDRLILLERHGISFFLESVNG